MGKVGTYLYFNGNAEKAFEFYQRIFGGELTEVMRYGDNEEAMKAMNVSQEFKNQIMHVGLPILDGHLLMGSDIPDTVKNGNNFAITLEPASREETKRLFESIVNNGGKAEIPLGETFWGSYHGSCTDQFGIQWMFDFPLEQNN
jgi:PhnB protein